MRGSSAKSADITAEFQHRSKPTKSAKPRRATTPVPIRFTESELAYLKRMAGKKPLSTFCREKLLGDKAEKRKAARAPRLDDGQYAALLAALGQSHLSSNLNQLAKHANMGTLDVSEDVETQLQEAYLAVLAMRDALITALGIKVR